MMKRILLLLALLPAVALRAETVTPQMAGTVADRVLQSRTHQVPLPADLSEMYLFVADNGYVVVAADNCVRPVLAYGDRWLQVGDSLPIAVHDWLKAYGDEIALRRLDKREASASTREEWQRLTATSTPDGPVFSVVVSPLLTTTWGQSPYYNNLCPSGCVTGCVATATAQVMKYWNHPAQGTGSHSYVDGSHGTLSANFGNTTYQWNLMPNSLNGTSSTSQINAVATLMFHLGVAMEMTYGSSSSATTGSNGSPTAVCAENALKTYFGYSQAIHHVLKNSMSDSLWCALIDAELMAARPILYSGRDTDGGHSFVLDGSNNAGYYHFNWGWKSYCDGYYLMGSLNPSPGGTGGSSSSTYNLKNGALMGVRPASDNPPASCMVDVTLTDAAHASVTGVGNHSFGDTVSLMVNTQAGYRFTRWSDGVHFNPRKMVLDSSLNLTAIVEPVASGTTVFYANSAHSTTYGAGGTFYWGMKLTSDDLERFDTLRSVQIFDKAAGVYELRLYRGGTSSPTTQFYTQSVTLNGSGEWVNIDLDAAQEVNSSMPLWVIFYNNTINYPAAVSTYAGHKNGSMCASGSGSNWHALGANYTFMVRAVFSEQAPCEDVREVITAEACDSYTWNGTTYTASCTDSLQTVTAGGCDSTVVLHLTINYSIDTNIYDTANGSYPWQGQTIVESGEYVYQGTTAAGCDSTVRLHLTLSIDEVGQAAQLQLYPNPVVEGVLTVSGIASGTTVSFYDLFGREQASFTASGFTCTFDVSTWPSGVYFLRVGNGLRRFVVRH